MTVLVTGATGFVGSHAVARLAGRGHEVRLLIRDPAKLARVPARRDVTITDVVVGDVTDRADVERALDGCTHVVHAAAHVSLAEREAAHAHDVGHVVVDVRDVAEGIVPFEYPLTYEAMEMATKSCPYDSDATSRALDLHPRTVHDTLSDSIRWFAVSGHVTRKLAGALAP